MYNPSGSLESGQYGLKRIQAETKEEACYIAPCRCRHRHYAISASQLSCAIYHIYFRKRDQITSNADCRSVNSSAMYYTSNGRLCVQRFHADGMRKSTDFLHFFFFPKTRSGLVPGRFPKFAILTSRFR